MHCTASSPHTPETFFSSVYWSVMRSVWAVCATALGVLRLLSELWSAAVLGLLWVPPQPVSSSAAASTSAHTPRTHRALRRFISFMGVLLSIKPRAQGGVCPGQTGG